jgi:hypothetical protein
MMSLFTAGAWKPFALLVLLGSRRGVTMEMAAAGGVELGGWREILVAEDWLFLLLCANEMEHLRIL